MNLRYWTYHTPFVHPFTISKGTKIHQPGLFVELEFAGLRGYGEAPAISYYSVSLEKMVSDLERKKRFVEKYAFTNPERYWHYLHHLFPDNPFLVCALDMAGWDLFGKIRQQPLYRLWGYDFSTAPLTNYTIGIDTVENMLKKISEKPWPVYKVKLGTPEDLQIITAIRKHTDARIRIDANAAWSLGQALPLVEQLHTLGVELIEQPLAADNWEGMKILYDSSPVPLIADESCVSEPDVARCAGFFHGINIKLTKCGGITPARRMIAEARAKGLMLMVGNMNETSVGTSAIAHLSPAMDYADLDGPLLLADDRASGLKFNNGRVSVSAEPGLGIRFQPTDPDEAASLLPSDPN